MLFIWFIYGLAFFVLGLVIIVYPKKGSMFKLANHIWLIAGFGIVHGINEWIDMFIAIEEPFPPGILKLIRLATLVGSFLFLLYFGTTVLAETNKKYSFIKLVPAGLFIIWALLVFESKQRLLMGDIFARYLLCAPGSFLTALGLFLQVPQFKETKLTVVTKNLRLAGIVFLFYGVFAGLIVKKTSFFPASVINYPFFLETFKAPVQIFRAGCAIILAGSAIQILRVFRWETEEAIRRSEQRCSMIVSAVPVIFFGQDRNSIITFAQGKGLELLGLKSEELIGRHISEVFSSVPQIAEYSHRALSGEEFVITITIDGLVFETCYSPLRDSDGEITGVIGVAIDVTAKMRAQEELDNYRSQLEKNARLAEVGTLSTMMAQQLEEPLAVTRLLLQRLIVDMGKSFDMQTTTDSLKKSLTSISKAGGILERFCTIAQVSSKITTEPIDLYQIAKRMMEVFAKSAQRTNLRIILKDMEVISHTPIIIHELEQVFFILIQNAINAADTDKTQKLTISCQSKPKQIELLFSDTYSYIEPAKVTKIFEPFFSIKPDTQDTNFSLAVAKQIVSAYGGDITVESKPGEGTKYCVVLPVE
jgi:PAS domain S-box-containing protein